MLPQSPSADAQQVQHPCPLAPSRCCLAVWEPLVPMPDPVFWSALVLTAPTAPVLLVTADPVVRERLRAALQSEGYRVEVVATDTAALALLRERSPTPFRLVLADPHACTAGGAAFVRAYRQGPPPYVPIIVLVFDTVPAALRPPSDRVAPPDPAVAPATQLPEEDTVRLDLLLALVQCLVGPAPRP